MPRRNAEAKERRHVHLNAGDWDWLVQTYGPMGLSPSHVIARLLSKYRRRMEEKVALARSAKAPLPPEETDLGLDIELPTDSQQPIS